MPTPHTRTPSTLTAADEVAPTPLLDSKRLAVYLNVPVSWIYDNVQTIPKTKVGRSWRFRLSEIDTWLAANASSQ